LWEKTLLYITGSYAHSLLNQAFSSAQEISPVQAGATVPTGDEWRRLEFHWANTQSVDTADDQWFTIDIVNYTNGNVDSTWTDQDYLDVFSAFNPFVTAVAANTVNYLELVDVRAAQKPGTEEVYWVGGKRIPFRAMLAEYAAVFPKIKAANDAAGYPTLHNHYTHAGYVLDRTSARDWVQANIPGGIDSTIGWMIDLDTTTENGGEADAQIVIEMAPQTWLSADYRKL